MPHIEHSEIMSSLQTKNRFFKYCMFSHLRVRGVFFLIGSFPCVCRVDEVFVRSIFIAVKVIII